MTNLTNESPTWESGQEIDRHIKRIRRRLLVWGRANFEPYEWRTEDNPWLTLVAEWLLQRTRARQAERAFLVLRERYPTPESLVRAGPLAARQITAITGLHWRAPHLYQLALAVNARDGSPPETEAELRSITGIGGYTAAAWLSLHRNKRATIVDSNIARWLARLTGKPYPRDPRHVRWVNDLAGRLTPRRAFREYNYAVLDFTMLVCTGHAPRCRTCPLRSECRYGQSIVV